MPDNPNKKENIVRDLSEVDKSKKAGNLAKDEKNNPKRDKFAELYGEKKP